MKKLLIIALLFAFASPAWAEIRMRNDTGQRQIPAFVPDPAKSQAPITGTYTFTKGTGGSLNITGWSLILIRPSADVTYYYNSDTTKVKTVTGGSDELIFVGQDSVTSVTVTLGANTAQVQGM